LGAGDRAVHRQKRALGLKRSTLGHGQSEAPAISGVMKPLAPDHLLSLRGIRRWGSEVGIPLLIPTEAQGALGRLDINDAKSLLSTLERFAALGSTWASAALGVILLYPDSAGKRDLEKVKELVRRPASEGDAYSLYVLAWAEGLSGNKAEFYKLLKRAAKSGFSPAVLDWAGVFQSMKAEGSLQASLKLLNRAENMGHLAARCRRFRLWITGRLGLSRRFPGVFGFIFSWMILTSNYRRTPFSINVFCIHDRFNSPPIRRLR
jgi:hypothetical protein